MDPLTSRYAVVLVEPLERHAGHGSRRRRGSWCVLYTLPPNVHPPVYGQPLTCIYTLDIVQFMDSDINQDSDLGQTGRRDPDALPPSNAFELVMLWLYQGMAALGGGDVLFAVKGGLLTGELFAISCHTLG